MRKYLSFDEKVIKEMSLLRALILCTFMLKYKNEL